MPEKPYQTRRRWSVAFKRRVVAEASEPGVSVASVARRYDLNANQVFNWRRRHGGAEVFLPVEVRTPGCSPPAAEEGGADGLIEISLAGGHRVAIRGGFDADRVARLLRVLSS